MKQKGFTLLEVLVASFILFIVISTMTMVYRGAILSSEKAERSVQISASVSAIQAAIANQVHSSHSMQVLNGQGTMGKIAYQWRAEKTAQALEPNTFNADIGSFVPGERSFGLWTVYLDVQYQNTHKQYQFSEVSW